MNQDLEHISKYRKLSLVLLVALGIIIAAGTLYLGYWAFLNPNI